jgi:capsular exopolysaccharide synthesis family protein
LLAGTKFATYRAANFLNHFLWLVTPGLVSLSAVSAIVLSLRYLLRMRGETQREIGVGVLGVLPSVQRFSALSAGANDSVRRTAAEGYRDALSTLLSTIFLEPRNQPLRSILLTSAGPGEGKSTCAAQMATAHARQGFRTLLIDANLNRPALHRIFGASGCVGLSNAIAEEKSLREVRQPVTVNLDLVAAGSSAAYAEVQIAIKIEEILAQARKEYDVVFIDGPPLPCFDRPLRLACAADGVLVVSLSGQTSQQAVRAVLSALRRRRANTLGVVLNQARGAANPRIGPYGAKYGRQGPSGLRSA